MHNYMRSDTLLVYQSATYQVRFLPDLFDALTVRVRGVLDAFFLLEPPERVATRLRATFFKTGAAFLARSLSFNRRADFHKRSRS